MDNIFDWNSISEAFTSAALSFDGLVAAMQQMSRIVVTDELLHSLQQAGTTGWMAGYNWRRDWTRMVNYGTRRRVRPPRREKRRARKRRGKR